MAVKEKEEVNTSDERAKALKLAIDKIEKDFGKGAIMKLGDKPAVSVETIPTGALALDVALGAGDNGDAFAEIALRENRHHNGDSAFQLRGEVPRVHAPDPRVLRAKILRAGYVRNLHNRDSRRHAACKSAAGNRRKGRRLVVSHRASAVQAAARQDGLSRSLGQDVRLYKEGGNRDSGDVDNTLAAVHLPGKGKLLARLRHGNRESRVKPRARRGRQSGKSFGTRKREAFRGVRPYRHGQDRQRARAGFQAARVRQ